MLYGQAVSASGESQDYDVSRVVAALTGMMLLWRSPLFQERFNDAAGPAFDSTEGWIVWVLHWRSDMRPADLVRELGINAPGVTKAIARLEVADMVVKTPHPEDARSVIVALTHAGVAAALQMETAAARLVREALIDTGARDRKAFADDLQQLSVSMQAAARRILAQ